MQTALVNVPSTRTKTMDNLNVLLGRAGLKDKAALPHTITKPMAHACRPGWSRLVLQEQDAVHIF